MRVYLDHVNVETASMENSSIHSPIIRPGPVYIIGYTGAQHNILASLTLKSPFF